LKEIGGRFTSPVLPGQTLVTHIWTQPAKNNAGDIQVDFAQQIKETGKWSLAGCALIAAEGGKARL
jgi:acyl dehydratase